MPHHSRFVELILHPDIGLQSFFIHYGAWAYAVLFLIVFCETGLVITPFLPGDSLLFAAGLMAQEGKLNPLAICLTLVVAAICGDNVNYYLGRHFGRRLFLNEKSKIFNHRSLHKTHQFFEKYGTRTVIIARFLPVFRTFAPFVAGMGRMRYRLFLAYSLFAAALWVGVCVMMAYYLGSIPWVRDHFLVMLVCLIILSAIPGVLEIYRHFRIHKEEARVEGLAVAEVPIATVTTTVPD